MIIKNILGIIKWVLFILAEYIYSASTCDAIKSYLTSVLDKVIRNSYFTFETHAGSFVIKINLRIKNQG